MNRTRPLLVVSVSSEIQKRISDEAASSFLPRSHVVENRLRVGYGMPPCDYKPTWCHPTKAKSKLLGVSISAELSQRIAEEETAEPDKPRSRLVENRIRMGYGMPPMARKARRNA